jgi:hypothetical protein
MNFIYRHLCFYVHVRKGAEPHMGGAAGGGGAPF